MQKRLITVIMVCVMSVSTGTVSVLAMDEEPVY